MKRRRLLILVAGLLIVCVIGAIVFNSIYYNPKTTFKRVFGFELPDSVVIMNYEHREYLFLENYAVFKILLNESDYIDAKHELSKKLDDIGLLEMTESDFIPHVENNCSWWDLKEDDIQLAYHAMLFGKKAKTTDLYVFFTKNEQGDYFLYIESNGSKSY